MEQNNMSLGDKYLIEKKVFQCPYCVSTPLAEVYQCENGHMLCDKCILQVGELCPMCRVPFGEKKIRNLTVEAALDEVSLPCSSHKYGCTKTMKRNKVINHEEVCEFRAVNICKVLALSECEMKFRSGIKFLKHLLAEHNYQFNEKNKILQHILINQGTTTNENVLCLSPISIKLNGKTEPFLILTKMKAESQYNGPTTNFTVLYLGDDLKTSANVRAVIDVKLRQEQTETFICSWTGRPLYFKAAEDPNKIPYLCTSTDYIKTLLDPERGDDFHLLVRVTMTHENSPPDNQNSSCSDPNTSSGSSKRQISPQSRSTEAVKRTKES